jgi:hypothetical protein
MAETLGSLCDKLTIVKLKQWHSDAPDRLRDLALQEGQLTAEIDNFLVAALAGTIPVERLTFASNKVYKKEGNELSRVTGTVGQLFSQLAQVNCALWHEQEKVYEFETVPPNEKDKVIKRLALLNLERNQCIDGIDREFRALVQSASVAPTLVR